MDLPLDLSHSQIYAMFIEHPATQERGKSGECKHCNQRIAWNISNSLRPHIEQKCVKFDRVKAAKRKRVATITDFFSTQDKSAEELFAIAVLTSTATFSQFESPEWEAFWKKMKFSPPKRNTLRDTWLPRIYGQLKQMVEAVADSSSYIQIVQDGSSNIAKERIENISFIVGDESYYWQTTAVGAAKASAEATTENIVEEAKKITKGDLTRWNAFSSDTDSTQRAVWSKLRSSYETQHVHSVPCDSHGLQLLLKDILFPGTDSNNQQIQSEISTFWAYFPNAVVSFFARSTKELAYFREGLSKLKAFIATVPTRWGTQSRQADSVLENKVNLTNYAEKPYTTTTIKLLVLSG